MFASRLSLITAATLVASSLIPAAAGAAPRFVARPVPSLHAMPQAAPHAFVVRPPHQNSVPWRIEQQRDRIQQGVRSGQLTFGEYMRDRARLAAIQRQRITDMRRNGGHLTNAERAQLQRKLNRDSWRIWFTKHNRADQPGV
jgi:hypothetical protein